MKPYANIIRALLLVVATGGAGLTLYTVQSGAVTPVQPGAGIGRGIAPTTRGLRIAEATLAAGSLPGGASSLNETYQDWQVSCAIRGEVKQCAMLQAQAQQNGQRVFSIELGMAATGMAGVIILPFGLVLDKGASLAVDDTPLDAPLHYRTCLPVGCLLLVGFDPGTLISLRAGTALRITAFADDTQEQSFSVSLKGFSAALDRVIDLAVN